MACEVAETVDRRRSQAQADLWNPTGVGRAPVSGIPCRQSVLHGQESPRRPWVQIGYRWQRRKTSNNDKCRATYDQLRAGFGHRSAGRRSPCSATSPSAVTGVLAHWAGRRSGHEPALRRQPEGITSVGTPRHRTTWTDTTTSQNACGRRPSTRGIRVHTDLFNAGRRSGLQP
jgi:hypothetical protein